MDIRKPKPIHGWREFFTEIGVIFIGVTIALTAEQIVEVVHWRTEVAEIKATLDDETRAHLAEATERVAIADCKAKQLRTIEDVVRQAQRMPASIPRVTSALRPWTTSGWTVATTSGVLPHMPLSKRDAYAEHYNLVQQIGNYNQQEFLAIGALGALRGSEVLSDIERDRLLADIVKASQLNWIISTASTQLLNVSSRLRIKPLEKANLDSINKERVNCARLGSG